MRGATGQMRLGTAIRANASAGFKKDPTADGSKKVAPILETVKEKSEEENLKEMEEEVNRLLESSAELKVKKNFHDALMKAKDAATKEKKIR